MKDSPLAHLLLEVPWQFYVTLTFGANWSSGSSRNKQERIYKWLRLVSRHHRRSPRLNDWRWVIAEEYGESGGRYHVHLLLADLSKPTRSNCHAMSWLWKSELKGGFSVIRPFDRSLSGVAYVLKTVSASRAREIGRKLENGCAQETARLEREVTHSLTGTTLSDCWNVSDANAYEVAKIGKGQGSLGESTVTLSTVLETFIRGLVADKETRSLTRRGITDKYRPWKR